MFLIFVTHSSEPWWQCFIQTSVGGIPPPPKFLKPVYVLLAYLDYLFYKQQYLHLVWPKATSNLTVSDSKRQCPAANIRSLLCTCLLLRLPSDVSLSGRLHQLALFSQLSVTYELPYQGVSTPGYDITSYHIWASIYFQRPTHQHQAGRWWISQMMLAFAVNKELNCEITTQNAPKSPFWELKPKKISGEGAPFHAPTPFAPQSSRLRRYVRRLVHTASSARILSFIFSTTYTTASLRRMHWIPSTAFWFLSSGLDKTLRDGKFDVMWNVTVEFIHVLYSLFHA